jgi:hypothetical protein
LKWKWRRCLVELPPKVFELGAWGGKGVEAPYSAAAHVTVPKKIASVQTTSIPDRGGLRLRKRTTSKSA